MLWPAFLGGATEKPALSSTPDAVPPVLKQAAELNLPPPAKVRELVRLAREQEKLLQYSVAAQLFLMAAQTFPAAADGALDEAARLQMLAKDYSGAIVSLKTLIAEHKKSSSAQNAPSRLTKAYEAAGNFEEAIAVHRSIINQAPDSRLKYYHLTRAGELLAQKKQFQEAAKYFNLVLNSSEPNRYAVRALKAYQQILPPQDPLAGAALALEFGERMYKAKAYQQAGPALDLALTLYEKGGPPPARRREFIAQAADALLKTNNNERAAHYYNLLKEDPSDDFTEVLGNLGKLYTRLGNAEQARNNYQALLKTNPKENIRRTARYQLSLLDMEEGRYGTAFKYFSMRAREKGGNAEFLNWMAAWNAYRAGNHKTALKHLDLIKPQRRRRQAAVPIAEATRYAYWRGRILFDSGRKPEGLTVLQTINRQQPTDYFGWRSAEFLLKQEKSAITIEQRLDQRDSDGQPLPSASSNWWRSYPELQGLGRIILLADCGLWRSAAAEMNRVEPPASLSPSDEYELALLYQKCRNYDLARHVAQGSRLADYIYKSNASPLRTYYPLIMPLGYADAVEEYAKRYKLPLALIYAIILNESGFRPSVVSPAYAIGLMQIMPATGEEIAAALNEPYDEDTLYDPETNLRYGCWYLRHLLDRLGGDPGYAIAAYNAGPQAVTKWLRLRKDLDPEFFVAEIPYQETNRYVRKVLTSMKQYEILIKHAADHR